MNTVKLKWLRKLAKTRNYVILTDTESIINIRNVNPKSFKDIQLMANQQMVLGAMRDRLVKVIDQYDKEIVKRTTIRGKAAPKKAATKIPVKFK